MRLVIARCSVDYDGRLTAHLPLATRLLVVKADGSVLVHSDGGSYKPLNWMSPPCTMAELEPDETQSADGVVVVWRVQHAKSEDRLTVLHPRGPARLGPRARRGPGAGQGRRRGPPAEAARRAHPHARRRLLARAPRVHDGDRAGRHPRQGPAGASVAVEIKRRGEIDGVEQLTRYLELMNRDPLLAPVTGVFAAQVIKPQARTLAEDRGIRCVVLDYDALKGIDDAESRLF